MSSFQTCPQFVGLDFKRFEAARASLFLVAYRPEDVVLTELESILLVTGAYLWRSWDISMKVIGKKEVVDGSVE